MDLTEEAENYIMPDAAEAMLTGQFNWMADDYKLALLDSRFDFQHTSVKNINDIYRTWIVATSPVLTNKLAEGGYAHAEGALFPDFNHTEEITQAFLYRVSDGLLVVYYHDSNELPFMPLGKDYYILPNAHCSGWFVVGQKRFKP